MIVQIIDLTEDEIIESHSKKEVVEMLSRLQRSDEITSAGGLRGRVVSKHFCIIRECLDIYVSFILHEILAIDNLKTIALEEENQEPHEAPKI